MSSKRVKLKINLSLLKNNIEVIREKSRANILAMIKANAYGHGINEIYHFLKDYCEICHFGLASIEEAVTLRRVSQDYSSSLVVFSDLGFCRDDIFSTFANEKVIPVISSWADLDYFLGKNAKYNIPLYLKLNTGMNRLGISYEDVESLVSNLKKRNIKKIDHLMTHFSSSNLKVENGSKCFNQYEVFKIAKKAIVESGIKVIDSSVSNSGAIEQGIGLEESFIRPGILLYGASVLSPELRASALIKTKLISSMETSVIKTFNVKQGSEIGYGDVKLKRDGKIVLVGVGYGDGLPTRFSGAKIKTSNNEGEIVGRVNMDMTAILFPENASIEKGGRINIWGEGYSNLTEIADDVGLIPYEVLCNIGQRVNKEYTL